MLVLAPDSYGRQKSLRCGKLVLVACTAVPARPCPAQLGARSGKHRSENHFFATVRKAATIKRSPPHLCAIQSNSYMLAWRELIGDTHVVAWTDRWHTRFTIVFSEEIHFSSSGCRGMPDAFALYLYSYITSRSISLPYMQLLVAVPCCALIMSNNKPMRHLGPGQSQTKTHSAWVCSYFGH